jgi:protein disulfide-isomerase A1
MKYTFFLLALIAVFALFSNAYGDDHDHNDDVFVLTGSNFDTIVAQHSPLLVKFYAPWCGHCKKLAAPFAAAAHELHGKASLADCDCTDEANKAVCAKYGIKGFPTLKIFDGIDSLDTPVDYAGQRTKESIVVTMKKAARPAFSVTETTEEFDAIVADPDNSIVVALYNAEGTDNTFESIATKLKNVYSFVIVKDSETAAAHGVSEGGIFVHRDFDEGVEYTYENLQEGELSAFLTAESFPPLGEIGPDNYKAYVDRGLPIVWCFFDPEDGEKEAIFETYIEVAKANKGKLSFVKLDGVQWAKHAESYGVTKIPAVVIDTPEKKRYIYDNTRAHRSASKFGGFVEQYHAGELEPFVKSEPVPEDNDGGVFVLVGSQYDEIVANREQDVFVEYYAPWCGHCKKLAPIWEELGEKYGDDDRVVVAKCDATANDVPEAISGFPTLMYYPANGEPVKYSGAREFADLDSYIADRLPASSGHDEL